jgi:hypothetical protein
MILVSGFNVYPNNLEQAVGKILRRALPEKRAA